MAVKMVVFWVSLIFSAIGANADGQFSILHSPDSLKFTGSSDLLESTLTEIFSASLGLSVEEDSSWNGLSIVDPFNTPEAIVEVYIDGVPNLLNSDKVNAKYYSLTADEYEPDTYEKVENRIHQHFPNGENKLVSINLSGLKDLSKDNVFGGLTSPKISTNSYQYLKVKDGKTKNDVVEQFLLELESLKYITNKVKSGAITADRMIDFYYFRFGSLHDLSDFYSANSPATKEAKKLLVEALDELKEAFVQAYDGSVLMTCVCTDVAHTRRVRAVSTASPRQALVSEDAYSADYAAIFNIILWFGVVFTFTLVAIVYAIMDMDPGRDSIIYRMTNTRIKKDN